MNKRKRVFCWVPTPVYVVQHWQNGYAWLSFRWLDSDGRVYEAEEPMGIDIDELLRKKT